MVSSPPSHTRSRGLVVAVATLATAVLLSLVLYAGAPDAPRAAAAGGRFVGLEQVPVQLSLSVAPGQVLQPGQAVTARVGPYIFNGVVAGQQPSFAYAQPDVQPQYALAQQPQYAPVQPQYAYQQPQYAPVQPQYALAQPYAPVQPQYAQPVYTGMPGFQLVDMQPTKQLQRSVPSKTSSKTIDIPFFDAKHEQTASHAALVAEAKSVDAELKRIEQHVQRMNIKRAEEATQRVQAEREALLQQARVRQAKEQRKEEDRLIERRAEQLAAQRMKSQKLTVIPAQSSQLNMYSVGSNGFQAVPQGSAITGTQSGRPFTGTVQSISVAPYSSYPPAGTTTQFRIPSFTPEMELKARIKALQKRLKSVAVDNALFQQQNALEKRISQAEQKILTKTGSPLSYGQVVLRMNLLEKRLARLEKLGVSSPAQIRVVPGSSTMTPDEAAVHAPLQSSSIHGTTGDYYFSGTLAPAVALSDDASSPPGGNANAAPEEWHTTPRMLKQEDGHEELSQKPTRHVSLAAVPSPNHSASKADDNAHLTAQQRLKLKLLQRIKGIEARMQERLHEA